MSNGKIVPVTRKDRLKLAVNAMLERGATGTCTIEDVSQWSGYPIDSQNLSFFVSLMRQVLCDHGLYLSGEGQDGKSFFIVRNTENSLVARAKRNAASKQIQMMESLLIHTDHTGMTQSEERRHERELRKIRYLNRMSDRREDVIAVLEKHKPGILHDDVEI